MGWTFCLLCCRSPTYLMDKNWKRFERRVAEVVGVYRFPVNGRKELDVRHPHLGIECKHRKTSSEWLFKRAWGQAVAGSKAGGHIPVVCVGEQNSSDIFAIVELKTLVTLLEYALKEGEEIHVVEL